MFFNNRKYNISLWFALHLILILLAFRSFPFQVNTDLISILPDLMQSKEILQVEDLYSGKLGSEMTVLIGSTDFQEAKSTAGSFYKELENIKGIQDLVFEMGTGDIKKYQDLLFKYRYRILSPNTKALLENNDIQSLSERAMMSVYSPVSMGSLDYLEDDPFLISSDSLLHFVNQSLTNNTSLSLKDSVLSRTMDDMEWVLITMNLNESGIGVELENNPVAHILSVYDEIKRKNPELEILLSGTPFHSYQSTLESKRQITIISTIASLFIILFILFVFRSFIPLIFTLLAIFFGIISGLAATISIFNEIHIFTVVFGTSLIGISVDYSFHYFSEWSDPLRRRTGRSILKDVLSGISLGLITTIISYAAFTITSFPLLQQMAVFSITGLISTFLTVVLLFPYVNKASVQTSLKSTLVLNKIGSFSRKLQVSSNLFKVSFILISLLIIFGMSRFEISYSLSDLYKMTDKMSCWEQKSASVLAHESSGVHFLVSSDDLESCLLIEELLEESLLSIKNDKGLKSYMSLSHFLPSIKRQDYNFSLVQKSLLPMIPYQKKILGIESGSKENSTVAAEYLHLEDLTEILPVSLMKGLHIGQVADSYNTSVLLFGIRNMEALYALEKKIEGVYLIDHVGQTEEVLKNLSILMIKIIILSYLLIFIGLIIRYHLKKAFLIIGIPLFASVICLSTFSIMNIPINLFVIIGLILIPGMGTDYLIILFESKQDSRSLLSISMSFTTTALSFGMLYFASITALFGMTVFLGLLGTYVLTLFITDHHVKKNN